MQYKHVNKVLKGMGIDFGDAKIRIVRDERLIGTEYYGWTSPDKDEIQLYPDAFENREQLVKTLGHERIHLEQIRNWGPARDSKEASYYEWGPKFSEEYWWSEYQKGR